MGAQTIQPRTRTSRRNGVTAVSALAVVMGAALTLGVGIGTANAGVVATVPLATAATFGVLGSSTVTNTGPTVVNGLNVGVYAGSAITGFLPGIVTPPGTIHATDGPAKDAQADALIAFTNAAGRNPAPADRGLTDLTLATSPLQPGVYEGNLSLTGTVTLDNRIDPDAVFIFQASSDLNTSSGSVVKFTTPHASCNVFWEVQGSATLGTGSAFVGTVLAHTSITAQTGATITGRLLANTGAVTLDTNVIRAPQCAAVVPPSTDSSTPSSSPSVSTPPSTPSTPSSTPSSTSSSTPTQTTTTPPPASETNSSSSNVITTASTTAPSTATSTQTSTEVSNNTSVDTTTPALTTDVYGSETVPATVATDTTTPVAALTQPSFPGEVSGGYGPTTPTSPTTIIGALLMLLGALVLAFRLPAARRFIAGLRKPTTGHSGQQ